MIHTHNAIMILKCFWKISAKCNKTEEKNHDPMSYLETIFIVLIII